MTKYNSLEYHLEKLREALDKTDSAAKMLREEKGQIMEIPKMIRAQYSYSSQLDALEYPGHLSNYYGNSTWNRFDQTNEAHVNACLKKAEDRLTLVLETAKKYHVANEAAIENNKKCRENVFNFLNSFGIKATKYVEVKGGRNPKKDWIPCSYIEEINQQIPISDNYDNYVSTVKASFDSIKKEADNLLKKIAIQKQEDEKKLRESKEAAEAILYCQNNNINTETLSLAGIIDAAETHEQEKWVAENYPDGKTISHSCCDNCSKWTIGEHRCSCGNRRMNLAVEGKGSNRYAYAEAY